MIVESGVPGVTVEVDEERGQVKASLLLYAAIPLGSDDTPSSIMLKARNAPRLLYRAAGLRAAVMFNASLMPFLDMGAAFEWGGNVGRIVGIDRDAEHVDIAWEEWPAGEHQRVAEVVLRGRLMRGEWKLP